MFFIPSLQGLANPAATATTIVTSGLALHLDAANSASYPGSGTTWSDLTENGNNATLINGPAYNSENQGSISFDGSNDYATIAHSASISFSSALTISVWFFSGTNVADTVANERSFLYLKGETSGDAYNPFLHVSGTYAWAANGTQRSIYKSPESYIASNTWYNLTVSHSGGSTPLIYKNNVLSTGHTFSQGDGTRLLTTNSNPVTINGDSTRNSIGLFNGRIAIIHLYNRALSANDVAQNYNALKGRYGL